MSNTPKTVEWNDKWREHEYVPETDTAYTVECLRDMGYFLGMMNAARNP